MNQPSFDFFPFNKDKELTSVPQQWSVDTLAWRLDSLLILEDDIPTAEEFLTTCLHLSLLLAFYSPTPPPTLSIIPLNSYPSIPSPMSSATVKPAELQLGKPKVFNRSYKMAISWIHSIQFYLAINEKSYDTDMKGITSILLYMIKGFVLTWADIFQEKAIIGITIILRTSDDFLGKFQATFKHQDTARNVISWLSI